MKLRRRHLWLFAAISIHDFLVSWASFAIAIVLRVGMPDALRYVDSAMTWGALFAVIAALTYRMLGLSSSVWRYTSIYDIKLVAFSAVISVAVWSMISYSVNGFRWFPRTLSFILIFVLIAAMGVPRLVYRVLRDQRDAHRQSKAHPGGQNVLLVGASDQTAFFIELVRTLVKTMRIVGVLDHKDTRIGRSIHGVPILDTIGNLGRVVDDLARRGRAPERVVLCYPISALRPGVFADLARTCAEKNIKLVRQPDIADILVEQQAQEQHMLAADFLGRAETAGLSGSLNDLLRGKRVIVSGAGGTIGSELVRQVALYEPSAIGLVEISEFNLYTIEQEILQGDPKFDLGVFLCDVRNRTKLARLFKDFRPDIVIHAAALKHVPIVETNPCEGVLTNIAGTIHVADTAREAGAEAFILISTDKAVNPTSVLGATKRIAELYTGQCDRDAREKGLKTRFIAVRFGNVIGSSGSVIPKFKRQIELGGPVTVTHPEMTRYFMTTSEAVWLVLQAAGRGLAHPDERGQILVLKMGRPVKILDIARQMISLAGHVPDEDIKIEFTGLRPGERLTEDLFDANEDVHDIKGEAFMVAIPHRRDIRLDQNALDSLFDRAEHSEDAQVRKALDQLLKTATEQVSLTA